MRTIARRFIAAVFVLALVVASQSSFAYRDCSSTITVTSSGTQTCSTTCELYDDETGDYRGSMTIPYQCKGAA